MEKITITIEKEIKIWLKNNHVNVSKLINELLKKYQGDIKEELALSYQKAYQDKQQQKEVKIWENLNDWE